MQWFAEKGSSFSPFVVRSRMQMRFSFLEGGAEYFFLSLGCHHGCQQTVSIPEIVQVCMSTCIRRDEKILCLWLGEVCYCCSLTILPYPAWVLVLVLFVNKISPVYSQHSRICPTGIEVDQPMSPHYERSAIVATGNDRVRDWWYFSS